MKWAYLKKNALYLTESDLNKLGEAHWELTGFEAGNAYFKRPLQLSQQANKKPDPVPQLDTVLTYQGRAIEIMSVPVGSPTIDKLYRYQVQGMIEGSWMDTTAGAIDTAKSAIDAAMATQAIEQ